MADFGEKGVLYMLKYSTSFWEKYVTYLYYWIKMCWFI